MDRLISPFQHGLLNIIGNIIGQQLADDLGILISSAVWMNDHLCDQRVETQ